MQIDRIRQLGPGLESEPGSRLRNILNQTFPARLVGRDDDPATQVKACTACLTLVVSHDVLFKSAAVCSGDRVQFHEG
jgi:hypothetical protein